MLNLLLKDIAQRENMSVLNSATLKELIDGMNMNRKGAVVILEDQQPVGIMTERDVVEILYKGVDLEEKVEGYAKKTLVSTVGQRTVGYALNLTLENNIRRVVIVDETNCFLGVITQQDLLKYLEEDFYRLTIKVKHIMKKEGSLISVSPEDRLLAVLEKMFINRVSSVPVLENRKPVGIISERDILKLASGPFTLESPVGAYMHSPVDTAVVDSLLVEVVEVMNYKNIRRIVVVDDEGSAISMVTIRDVIENLEGDYNKFMERKLQSAKEILNLLPEMLIEVTDTGSEQLIIWVNDKVISKFGRGILDKPVTRLLPRETWNSIYANLTKLNKIDHIKLKIDDSIYELSGFFISTFGKMERGRYQLIMRDVTEDFKMSTVDPLTDIYNRRFINDFLRKEIERSKRMGRPFSVVISDVDDFKEINDSQGHLAGDTVLRSLSALITATVRKLDVVGRYGGDEFMLVLPDADIDTAFEVIRRLKSAIEDSAVSVGKDIRVQITASFGIASYPEDGTSLDDLLVTADERLYKAKSTGKNSIGRK